MSKPVDFIVAGEGSAGAVGNAASIMIGEKAAEMIAADHGVKLSNFVGLSAAKVR